MIQIAKKFYFLIQKNFTSICFFNSCSCRRKSSLFLRFKFSSSTLFASNCSRQARTRRSRSLASDVPTSSKENYSKKKNSIFYFTWLSSLNWIRWYIIIFFKSEFIKQKYNKKTKKQELSTNGSVSFRWRDISSLILDSSGE